MSDSSTAMPGAPAGSTSAAPRVSEVPRAGHQMVRSRAAMCLGWLVNRLDLRVLSVQIVLTAVALAGWQLAVEQAVIRESVLGSPTGIWREFRSLVGGGTLLPNMWATLSATVIGFSLGSMAGVGAGLLMGSSNFVDKVFMPLVTILNSMPRIAFAPLLIVWFGLTIWAKVWMAFSLCAFILLLNTRAAAKSVDRDLTLLARMNAQGRLATFWKITLPSSIPGVMAGLRLGVVYAMLGVVASEMIVAKVGLGTLIVTYSTAVLNVNAVLAVLVCVAFLAALMTAIVGIAERRLLRWQGKDSTGGY